MCSFDKTIKIWDLNSGECIKTLTGHNRGIMCIKHYIGDILVSISHDETIKIWNLTTGECTNTIRGHENVVKSLIFI